MDPDNPIAYSNKEEIKVVITQEKIVSELLSERLTLADTVLIDIKKYLNKT